MHVITMSLTLTGIGSELSCNYHPPIELEDDAEYEIGLVTFSTYNTIPNICKGNNTFTYVNQDKKRKKIIFPTGTYEIDDINAYLLRAMALEENETKPEFELVANNNTLQAEIYCKYDIDFTASDSIGKMLGFSSRILSKWNRHKSDNAVNIFPVHLIRIDCNLTEQSYLNSQPTHAIHSLTLDVDPGFHISDKPFDIRYFKISNNKYIDNITIRIVDQNGNLIDFRGETITLELHLRRKWDYNSLRTSISGLTRQINTLVHLLEARH